MTMIQQPDGTVINPAGGGNSITDLGAALGGVTRTFLHGAPAVVGFAATEAQMADVIIASVTGAANLTLVMPNMPVGAEVTFILNIDDVGGTVTIQEDDAGGVARWITYQDSLNTAIQFNIVNPTGVIAGGEGIDLTGQGVVGLLTLEDATICLKLKKIRASSTAIQPSDRMAAGWSCSSRPSPGRPSTWPPV